MIVFDENHLNYPADLEAPMWINGLHWTQNPNPEEIIEITNEIPPHSLPACCKFEHLNPSGGEWFRRLVARARYDPTLSELYGVAWHFFPEPQGAVTAFKEQRTDDRMYAWRLYCRPNGLLRVHEYYGAEYNLDVAMPLMQWFRTTIHIIRHRTDGLIEFYLNGDLIFSLAGQRTQWLDTNVLKNVWFSAHFLYVGIGDPPCYNYFDDVTLADSWVPITPTPPAFPFLEILGPIITGAVWLALMLI